MIPEGGEKQPKRFCPLCSGPALHVGGLFGHLVRKHRLESEEARRFLEIAERDPLEVTRRYLDLKRQIDDTLERLGELREGSREECMRPYLERLLKLLRGRLDRFLDDLTVRRDGSDDEQP